MSDKSEGQSDYGSERDSVPEITLRIPGPWESPRQLREALAKSGTGYTIPEPEPGGEVYLVHQPSGRRFRLSATEPDHQIGDLFADSGRMSPRELVDGDPIGGPDGPEFILRHVECTRFTKDMPWHNPYGVWRLERAEDGE